MENQNSKIIASVYNDPNHGLNFLGVKSAFSDIKNLPKYFKLLLIVGLVIILFFNFFSVETYTPTQQAIAKALDEGINVDSVHQFFGTHFSPLKQYTSAFIEGSPIGQPSQSLALASAILYSMNGIAAFTGLLSVSMIVNNKKSQFLWGLINGVFYAMFALVVGYTGDFLLNLIFICGAPFGWYLFTFKHKKINSLFDRKWYLKIICTVGSLIVIVGLVFGWYYLIPQLYYALFGQTYPIHATQHFFDAMATGMNTFGYGLQLFNFTEQFWIWEVLNLWKLIMYTPVAMGGNNYSITLIIQMAVWFTLSGIGLYHFQIKEIYQRVKLYLTYLQQVKINK